MLAFGLGFREACFLVVQDFGLWALGLGFREWFLSLRLFKGFWLYRGDCKGLGFRVR